MKRILVAVLVLGALAACGASSPKATPAAATTSHVAAATPTPSPTPTQMTITQAAAHYKALVKKADVPLGPLNHLFVTENSTNLKKLKALSAKNAATNWQFAKDLRAAQWPASVQSKINALVDNVIKEQDGWEDLAHARNMLQFDSTWLKHQDDTEKPANAVRLALGLPPA